MTNHLTDTPSNTLTNRDILRIAMHQSALDLNAQDADFLQDRNVLVRGGLGPQARKYYKEPIACNLVSYGSNIVASVRDEYRAIVEEYLDRFEFFHCFETPNLHWLDERMRAAGYRVCFMAEYFLPDVTRVRRAASAYELRVLTQADFGTLYVPAWSNALCADRKELDVLGVGPTTAGSWWGWRRARRTATPCGRLAWTSCRPIAGRGLLRR